MYQDRPPEELYGLADDPFELNNIAGDIGQRENLDSLRSTLDGWMEQQGDLGLDSSLEYQAQLDSRG